MTYGRLLNDAVAFAASSHAGQFRKGTKLPYIVHPMEAAAICASFTDDVEVLAAAVLHDTVEDTNVTIQQIEDMFGIRVANIVASDSEDERDGVPAPETWKMRKAENIGQIASAVDIGVKMVCLGDKLSNIRAIQRDFGALGNALWERFNQSDPAEQAWYYSTIADELECDLGDTEAWHEYRERVDSVFSCFLGK